MLYENIELLYQSHAAFLIEKLDISFYDYIERIPPRGGIPLKTQ